MSPTRTFMFLATAALTVAPAAALAQCVEGGLPEGPVPVAYLEGDFGVARRACPRTELALRGRGMAIIDTPNFYGYLGGGAGLAASYRWSDRMEVFAAVDAFEYRYIVNATLSKTTSALGPASLGATYVVTARQTWLAAGTLRLSLPTSTLYRNAWPLGLEAGGTARMQALPWLVVHGSLGLMGSMALTAANAQPRLGVSLVAGVEVAPLPWLAIAVDPVNVSFFYAHPLDHWAPAVALRAQALHGLGLELAGMLPLAGGSRYNFAGALRLSWRFT